MEIAQNAYLTWVLLVVLVIGGAVLYALALWLFDKIGRR